MDHSLKITVKEPISAPVSTVWKALTDEEMIRQYFFGTKAESDWKKDSPITFRGEWEGNEYLDKGTILEIEEEKLLKYDYWSSMSGLEDKPENYATVTYRLQPDDGQTILTIIQEGFRSQEACDHSSENWKVVINQMKALIEE